MDNWINQKKIKCFFSCEDSPPPFLWEIGFLEPSQIAVAEQRVPSHSTNIFQQQFSSKKYSKVQDQIFAQFSWSNLINSFRRHAWLLLIKMTFRGRRFAPSCVHFYDLCFPLSDWKCNSSSATTDSVDKICLLKPILHAFKALNNCYNAALVYQ